uniref:Eukaryotic translation initiation factor 4 gamma 1 n=1 Tax=Mus spicilegus TaxID=10103 RepID=A0A8C6HA64_MUSSI
MNKAPQPTGPPPARSPGLPQPAFPPGQTAPVVFSTPQATQMNTPSQPRQHFYPKVNSSAWSPPSFDVYLPFVLCHCNLEYVSRLVSCYSSV